MLLLSNSAVISKQGKLNPDNGGEKLSYDIIVDLIYNNIIR